MENEAIPERISAVYALSDAIDNICMYFNMKDLSHVSQVCKAWNEGATREIARRCHIQRILMPYGMDEKNISSVMYVKPYVTLLFFDHRTNNYVLRKTRTQFSLPNEFSPHYRKLFPNNIIGLEVREYFINEDASLNSPYDFKFTTEDYKPYILGLLFPMGNRIDVKVYWGNYGQMEKMSDQIIEKLEIDEVQKKNSAFLIFSTESKGWDIVAKINDAMKRRSQNNEHTVWVAHIDHQQGIAADCQSKKYDELSLYKDFVVLRLSSSSFQSWTLTIACGGRKEEIEYKLYEFRKKIQLKSFTFGLVYLPGDLEMKDKILFDCEKFMKTIRQIFSGIRIVGLLDCAYLRTFGSNFDYSNLSRAILNRTYMSIIVITYG